MNPNRNIDNGNNDVDNGDNFLQFTNGGMKLIQITCNCSVFYAKN